MNQSLGNPALSFHPNKIKPICFTMDSARLLCYGTVRLLNLS